jgi:hypothetical protein
MPSPDPPFWLHVLAIAALSLAVLCAIVTIVDEIAHPQRMWIMNLVWPLAMLFGGVLWLAGYWMWGRAAVARRGRAKPAAIGVAIAATHCGAGCTLGDMVAEGAVGLFPGLPVVFGWGSLFPDRIFAVWTLDYILAFILGIAFQYFTIRPMKQLTVWQGLAMALKADTLTVSAWQVGMYGFMALAMFGWLKPVLGPTPPSTTAEFWFLMQIAMLCGFLAAYPVTRLLIQFGVKEPM